MAPSFSTCRLLLAVAIMLHNAEEALMAPRFGGISRLGLKLAEMGLAVTPPLGALRFGLVVATIVPAAIILIAMRAGRSVLLDSLVCLISTLYLANAFLPHLAEFFVYHAYGPGLVSAVLINIPLCSWLLRQAVHEGRLSARRVWMIVGGGVVLTPMLIAAILIVPTSFNTPVPLRSALWRALAGRASRVAFTRSADDVVKPYGPLTLTRAWASRPSASTTLTR
jgi:hypothetical protein